MSRLQKQPTKVPNRERQIRQRIDRAYAVPRGRRKLFVIEAAVSVRSRREFERLVEAIQLVLCPKDPAAPHRCARPWFVITHPADAKERKDWKPLLNE
jgi:hypothetical protein